MLPDALRAYDRRNGLVVLVLALTGLGLWLGLRPAGDAALRAPVAAATPVEAPLTLRVSGGWLRLAGTVPDEASRRALQQAALVAFGADHVIDQLAVQPGAPALPWLPEAAAVLDALKARTDEGGLQLHRERIVLTGSVSADFHRVGRESQARQWFGRDRAIDNRTAVVPPAVAAAALDVGAGTAREALAAPACAGLREGVALAFVPGQPTLAPAGRQQLAKLRPCLGDAGRWRLAGHTDANGVEARNVELTQQRAEAVKAALVAAGMDAARLEAVGRGSAEPVADNASREGRLRNRRVSFEPLT